MNQAAARTRRLISVLRAAPLKPGRRRLRPPVAHETALARDYAAAIQRHLPPLREAVAEVWPDISRLLEERRRELGRFDGRVDAEGDEGEQDKRRKSRIAQLLGLSGRAARLAMSLLERAAAALARAFDPIELKRLTERFGEELNYLQRLAFDQVIRDAIGVPLSLIEAPIVKRLTSWSLLNVDLIRSIRERYLDRVRLRVLQAFEVGEHPSELASQLEKAFGMAETQAMTIARDQLGKLNGQLNEARQRSLGVDHYIWRTMRDNRVRDEHFELEGKRISWSEPPPVGPYGQPAHPGEAINCRCYAEPDIDGMLDDLEPKPPAAPQAPAPLAESAEVKRMKEILGDSLYVVDGDSAHVKDMLADLARVPEDALKRFKERGGSIYLGDRSVVDLDDLGHLRGTQPRGWPDGSTWDRLAGAAPDGKVVAGRGEGHSIGSVVLHELGHALGFLGRDGGVPLDLSFDLADHHARLFPNLSPYLQQQGKGGLSGCQELLAEGFSSYVKHGKEACAKAFDAPFADWIEAKVREFR